MPGTILRPRVCAALAGAAAFALALPGTALAQKRTATTTLFSVSADGGTPNGPSTNPSISGDLRYSQIIAFESEASNLVAGDTNGLRDVFAVRRAGSFADTGSVWKRGRTQLVSRGRKGRPANGPSFAPDTDGNAQNRARCVAFLSDATNLVSGDTNGQTDAFLARAPDFVPKRVSLPANRQARAGTTHVAVSGDCSRVAFVTGGRLYERASSRTRRVIKGHASDPDYDSGDTNALVFGARGDVYLVAQGTTTPRRVVRGGRNPAYINRRRLGKIRRYLVYEVDRGGHSQIGYRAVGGGERIITSFGDSLGNGDSSEPTIFNSGFNAAFVSDASNLATKTSRVRTDRNGVRDAYFWTDTHDVTILESVDSSSTQLLGGAANMSTSYYRNYVVFDSPGGSVFGTPHVYLRYLGGI